MEKSTHKIGTNRGRKRIWLDGKRLANHGFTGGQKYYLTKNIYHSLHKNELVLSYSPKYSTFDKDDLGIGQQIRKVTGRPDGKPIIDITGATVSDTFPGDRTHVEVEYSDCRIVIRLAQQEK